MDAMLEMLRQQQQQMAILTKRIADMDERNHVDLVREEGNVEEGGAEEGGAEGEQRRRSPRLTKRGRVNYVRFFVFFVFALAFFFVFIVFALAFFSFVFALAFFMFSLSLLLRFFPFVFALFVRFCFSLSDSFFFLSGKSRRDTRKTGVVIRRIHKRKRAEASQTAKEVQEGAEAAERIGVAVVTTYG